jgi:hypothetical protein
LLSQCAELEKQIRDVESQRSMSIRGQAVEGFKAASESRESYQQQRKGGRRKVGAVIQHSLNSLSHVIASFSNIVETVASAGGPYGQVGYQTLSILLIVSNP